MDIVAVHAAGGGEAGMQVVGHEADAADGNILRQQLVELIAELLAVNGAVNVEVGHHHAGMNAGISTPCACHGNVTTEQQRQRSLQLLLHRVAVGLNLPAVIACTIVAESNKISHRLRMTIPRIRRAGHRHCHHQMRVPGQEGKEQQLEGLPTEVGKERPRERRRQREQPDHEEYCTHECHYTSGR